MPFDFKKEYKEFYLPKNLPEIVDVPDMNYVAVRGTRMKRGAPISRQSASFMLSPILLK